MAVTGGTLAGGTALARLTTAWRADLRIVVQLRPAAGGATAAGAVVEAVTAARALAGVEAVRAVSATEALAELRRYLGPAGEGLDRLPANPLAPRLEVTPEAALDAAGLQALLEALGRLPGVETVQAAVGWVGWTERLTRALALGGLGLGALLGLGAIVAIGGATAAARRARADETAVLRLAGAREAWLRGPLLLQAGLQGAAGAVLGLGLLWLVSDGGAAGVAGWLQATAGVAPLPVLPWAMIAALLGGGLAGGLAGGVAAGAP